MNEVLVYQNDNSDIKVDLRFKEAVVRINRTTASDIVLFCNEDEKRG